MATKLSVRAEKNPKQRQAGRQTYIHTYWTARQTKHTQKVHIKMLLTIGRNVQIEINAECVFTGGNGKRYRVRQLLGRFQHWQWDVEVFRGGEM